MMDNDDSMLNNRGPQPGAETVYGTEDNNMVMSEKNEQVVSIVQQLAGSIYQEFERMINRYDEDVVKNLMPLLVNVLECLDASYRINQEQDVEVELLREDNEQLVTQYEREKGARKQAEQKLLEAEDLAEQENKELASRLESLESIVRMLELKHKNSLEHSSRLEERESELKKEYNKLHERYTELFKNHVDYMERTKMLMGSTHSQMSSASERLDISRARLNPVARSSGPVSYGFASLENSAMLDTETICSVASGSDDSGPPSLHNELESLQTMERAAETDTLQQQNQATSPQSDASPVVPNAPANVGRSTTKKEQRSANTLYQELSFQDNEESEENEIVTGSWVHPGEYASSGMGKEVENLIMENTELLATKNALNIVKDDLIVKVDELTGEIEILREELAAMSQSRNKLRQKVSELEEELKKTKEQVKHQADNEQDENDVPLAQRKRFTRVEMAMVLMERNQYKERLMELQEAVRLTEILRASRTVDNLDKKSKQSIWKYFSNLFTPANRPQERVADGQGGGPMFRYSSPSHNHGSPSRGGDNRLAITSGAVHPPPHPASAGLANALIQVKDYAEEGASGRASARRREQYRQLRAHVPKEDGRLHAYGWSLPINKSNHEQQSRHSGGVPVPVYCNPLAEASPHMKVFCAAGVNLNGGFTKDGHSIIPSSSPYAPRSTAKIAEITSPTAEHSAEAIDRQISRASLENLEPETQLTSYVWICTSTHAVSTVTVIDVNQPANVLDAFPICQSHLLCIASVQGAMENDYALLENSEVIKAGEMLERPGEGPELFGKVEFIRVRPKSDQNRNNNCEVEASTAAAHEQAQEVVPAEVTAAEEKAKEATEKSNDLKSTGVISPDTLRNINEIKIRQPLPGVPQRLSAPEVALATNNNNSTGSNDETEKQQEQQQKQQQYKFSSKPVNPILGTQDRQEPLMSSVGPTMWLGAQDGMLYVHSSVGRWNECLHKVLLPDAVLGVVHVESRVVVALANAQLAVFRRQTDGQWDLNSYHLVTLGDRNHSIRCLCVAGERIWAANRNKIFIVDPISLNIIHSLEAHPRKESQVRQMAATGAGVWVSIRLDSTLRLYHTHTFEHKQDVDIEPYVSKMLGTGKLGFSFVRITSLMVSCNRLWIGTSNGVIISVPLSEGPLKSAAPNTQIPLCCMANAQLSFHGHRDAVKFFVSVPMNSKKSGSQLQFINKRPDMLVMCGGEGYIDFRLGDNDMESSIHLEPNQTIENRGDKSFLIVWHVSQR